MVSHNKDKSFKEVLDDTSNIWSPDLLKRVVHFPDNEDGWFKRRYVRLKELLLRIWYWIKGYRPIKVRGMGRGSSLRGSRYSTVIFDDMEEENNNGQTNSNNRILK